MHVIWRIKLFGWLRLERVDGPNVDGFDGEGLVEAPQPSEAAEEQFTRFPTQKAALLLASLALEPGHPLPRDVLLERLWPEADPEPARNRFRVTLSSLRRLLETPDSPDIPAGSVLLADRSTVRLGPSVTSDVLEFEQALALAKAAEPSDREHHLLRAVELCKGELLPGFYEDWVVAERERLGSLLVEALRELGSTREARGDLPGAIEAYRKVVALEPLSELSHQRLMALHLASGEPAQALRQYREVRRILKRAVGQPPSPETRAIAEAIRARTRQKTTAPVSIPDAPSRETATAVPAPAPEHPAAGASLPPLPIRRRSTLPLQITRFFGREEEMDQVEAILTGPDSRLVTLTGPGGSGKTRLALEVARRLDDRVAVWFVRLAEMEDPGLLPDAILDALRLRRVATVETLEQVIGAIGNEPAVLVLDNLEHIVEGAAPVVAELLERAPDLRCLVTSQVRLQVAGEREFPVVPLVVPNGLVAPDHLAACPSVRLFIDRAQGVRPDFQLTRDNAEAIAAICRHLEGLPLALELAAAWAHTLSPSEMLQRLANRFDLLVSRRRDAASRHHALRAALDWSFQLLSDPLQRVFARLSVFRNGWTLAEAEDVLEEPGLLEQVAALQERSFLVAEEAGGQMRFSMLETLHEYAAERLPEAERIGLGRRHAGYYQRLAKEAEPRLCGPGMEGWLDFLERRHDNIRAALDFSLGPDGDPVSAIRTASALGGFWEFRGHFQEGRGYLARALEAVTAPAERLPALNAAARLAVCQGDAPDGMARAKEALEIARSLGDTREQALALRNIAFGDYIRADYALSIEHQEESLVLFRALGDTWGVAACLDDMGSVYGRTGDYEGARRLLEESLEIYKSLGHREGVASALFGLGVVARDIGDLDTARELLEESLAAGRELRDVLLIALAVNALGTVAALSGDLESGRTMLTESLTLFRELRDSRGLFFALYHLAMCVERRIDRDRAEESLREALRLTRQTGDRRYTLYNIDGLATLAADRGQMELAARLFGKAEAYRAEIGHPWPPYQHEERKNAMDAVRRELGAEALTTLEAEGAAMSLEEAIRYALRIPLGPAK